MDPKNLKPHEFIGKWVEDSNAQEYYITQVIFGVGLVGVHRGNDEKRYYLHPDDIIKIL